MYSHENFPTLLLFVFTAWVIWPHRVPLTIHHIIYLHQVKVPQVCYSSRENTKKKLTCMAQRIFSIILPGKQHQISTHHKGIRTFRKKTITHHAQEPFDTIESTKHSLYLLVQGYHRLPQQSTTDRPAPPSSSPLYSSKHSLTHSTTAQPNMVVSFFKFLTTAALASTVLLLDLAVKADACRCMYLSVCQGYEAADVVLRATALAR